MPPGLLKVSGQVRELQTDRASSQCPTLLLSTPDRMPDQLFEVILNVRWENFLSSLMNYTTEENVSIL